MKADNDVFEESPFDSVVGLGLPAFAIKGTESVMDSLANSGALDASKRVFSFYLSKEANQPGSVFVLGGADQSLYRGQLTWHNVQQNAKVASLLFQS